MFSTIWGICFSLEANLNALKTSDSGTVVAQRERLLLEGPLSIASPSVSLGMRAETR
jgi:hypothetical protein